MRPAPPPGYAPPEGLAELDLTPFVSEHPRAELPLWRDGEWLVLGSTTPDDPVAMPVPTLIRSCWRSSSPTRTSVSAW
jgi:hypothetical protein